MPPTDEMEQGREVAIWIWGAIVLGLMLVLPTLSWLWWELQVWMWS